MDANTTLAADLLMIAAGKPGWLTPKLDLITAVSPPASKASAYADFTLAAYTGYSQVTPTLSAAYVRQPEEEAAFAMSQGVFLGPSSGSPATIIGWVLTDGSADVYAWGIFDTPVNMGSTSDRVAVNAEFPVAGGCSSEAFR